jgi:hypothetical protein
MDEISKTLEELLKPIFPDNAEINSFERSSDLIIKIRWKLTNDPNRPNKPSRRIEIIIPEDVMEDYLEKNTDNQSKDNEKIKQFIEQKFKKFNPEPETPLYASPPVEQWIVTHNIFDS